VLVRGFSDGGSAGQKYLSKRKGKQYYQKSPLWLFMLTEAILELLDCSVDMVEVEVEMLEEGFSSDRDGIEVCCWWLLF
jgi:hypothetical protein